MEGWKEGRKGKEARGLEGNKKGHERSLNG
jgi:hypothetical protein